MLHVAVDGKRYRPVNWNWLDWYVSAKMAKRRGEHFSEKNIPIELAGEETCSLGEWWWDCFLVLCRPRGGLSREESATALVSTSLSGEPFSIHVKKIPDDGPDIVTKPCRYAPVWAYLTEKERQKRTVGAMPLGSGSVPFGTSHSSRSHAPTRTRARTRTRAAKTRACTSTRAPVCAPCVAFRRR